MIAAAIVRRTRTYSDNIAHDSGDDKLCVFVCCAFYWLQLPTTQPNNASMGWVKMQDRKYQQSKNQRGVEHAGLKKTRKMSGLENALWRSACIWGNCPEQAECSGAPVREKMSVFFGAIFSGFLKKMSGVVHFLSLSNHTQGSQRTLALLQTVNCECLKRLLLF